MRKETAYLCDDVLKTDRVRSVVMPFHVYYCASLLFLKRFFLDGIQRNCARKRHFKLSQIKLSRKGFSCQHEIRISSHFLEGFIQRASLW